MAYYEMILRDRSRFADARTRMNQCPLGSAALAGTGFSIDRHATASALGFDAPTNNSLDSVSDRDFALDYLMAATQCSLHLSRLAEEFRSEEHTSELQSLLRISYTVFCLKNKTRHIQSQTKLV